MKKIIFTTVAVIAYLMYYGDDPDQQIVETKEFPQAPSNKKISKKTPNREELFEKKVGPIVSRSPAHQKTENGQYDNSDGIWREKLRHQLLRFHDENTKLSIKGTPKLVTITYTMPSGRRNSFKAQIEPKSGQIIRTWSRTIHENFARRPLKLRPTGVLP